MSKKEKLSRSLQSLLGGVIGIEADGGQDVIVRLNPEDIQPNDLQPRDLFNEEEMRGLVESVRKHGILQPVIVRPLPHGYMLIAGERRWRAAKQLGLKEIPAIVRHADGANILEIALIENIQREDLNPIEKAKGFEELIARFGLTQEQVAKAMGKDRSSVTNYLRLLDLPQKIQDDVSRGTLTMGHARALLAIQDKEVQIQLYERIAEEGLSVREIEEMVSAEKKRAKLNPTATKRPSTPHIEDLEDRFRRFLGTKVTIKERNGRGRIMIAFHTNEEFSRIANTLGIQL
ncbi:MAG: ParB/RepB/Spo0J family partition protein [Candidatus Brocadia sp. AMX2]|uniref:Chromosome partitioning protein ParB family n=1 Tax=Candidatus Brocadia sinica JPN1 TaxID=1197129 RepID=A0ABQ0JW04_9BACT|nr:MULTISPECIES: ParB/RepB/Spo0J family partition protein [Brocadia]MBC6931875.1 ParB/RepB/Spo0J family partition protein [Candidatus Brocadia sp.]MBL1167270.1 ParB/RepB/Spo0J family partition protein [Candidatus Brocadia sp. AMX1]NOG41257.1 ParB/RepB/Spo0J family partition protein [Planctomycetota bacterium]GIK14528.1 MAG: chromosome partitioning protein ParB [Candidatus Brocadia sinica]KAA0245680.1 MAG: ParB/RepB/Spo0J family partition protein [Candidatus Brocadia sp. AMX2]